MKANTHLFCALLFSCFSRTGFAQLKPVNVIRDTIYSNELKEKRALEIVLPANYTAGPTAKFDVTYITDGEWNTQIATNIDRFLEIQFIPSNIIVSIPNVYIKGENMRERDFTPTHIQEADVSGGADHYLAFLKNELMPYINKKYSTSGMNTLYGSSLAGIFTTYALIKEPRLFQSYLLADPALWWDNGYPFKLVDDNLGKLDLKDITLLMTGREGQAAIAQGIVKMDSIFRKKAPAGFHWKTMYYTEETHNSMIFRTLYDGLKYTYYGYSKAPIQYHPMNGVILKDKPLKVYFEGDFLKDLHYTTDGTAPTAASARVADKMLVVNTPAQIAVVELSNRPIYEQKATINFAPGIAFAAKPKQKNFTPEGWNYAYYEGEWDHMPDFKKLKPVSTGKAGNTFNPAKQARQHNFACVFTGQVEITQEGYHIFGLDSDGGSRLYIDDKLLIDYDGLHASGKMQSYVVPLAKGFHNFRLEYFEKSGDPVIRIIYTTPDNDNGRPIPSALQYGK